MRRLKWWHWLAIGVLTVAMMCGMLLILVFAPGVQRRAFLAAVESPGRTVAVERLSAGLGGVEIDGLTWTEEGQRVGVRELRVRMPVLAAIFRDRLTVEELLVRGVQVDLAASPAGQTVAEDEAEVAGDPAAKSRGEIDVLTLPRDVRVGRVMIDGEVLFAAEGDARPQVSFTVEGGGFEPGAEGALTWRSRIAVPTIEAFARGVELDGDLKVRQSAAREIEVVALNVKSPFLKAFVSAALPSGRLGSAAVDARIEGDLAPLMRLVPPDLRPALESGTMQQTLRIERTGEGAGTLTARTELRDLAGSIPDGAVRLAGITLDASANLRRGEPTTVRLRGSLLGTGAEDVSDLQLQGTVEAAANALRGDLSLASERLAVPAVQRLVGLVVPPTESEGPPWSGLEGRLAFALARVELPGGGLGRDIKGAVVIDSVGVSVRDLGGTLLDAPIDGEVVITHASESGEYALTANLGFENLDVGKALRALQPDRLPEIEGTFQARAKVQAKAADLPGLATAPRGEVSLRGGKGVYRGLRQKTGGALSTAAALLGAFTRSKTAQTVGDIGVMLEAVPYEEITLQASLGEGDVLRVQSLGLRAPELALTGSGSITLARGGSWLDWLRAPMALEMNLGGKGRLGQMLTQFGVAAPPTDPTGYATLKQPFRLGGSLSAADSSDLWTILGRAAANAASRLLEPPAPKPSPDESPGTSPNKAP